MFALVTATTQNLKQAASNGRFCSDLFHRLARNRFRATVTTPRRRENCTDDIASSGHALPVNTKPGHAHFASGSRGGLGQRDLLPWQRVRELKRCDGAACFAAVLMIITWEIMREEF